MFWVPLYKQSPYVFPKRSSTFSPIAGNTLDLSETTALKSESPFTKEIHYCCSPCDGGKIKGSKAKNMRLDNFIFRQRQKPLRRCYFAAELRGDQRDENQREIPSRRTESANHLVVGGTREEFRVT